MKITGKKSISAGIKIFLSILFSICILIMIGLPIVFKAIGIDLLNNTRMLVELLFMYAAGIPSLLMIIEFWKIFDYLSKDKVFDRKNEKRLQRSSIYCLIIGIIFLANIVTYFIKNENPIDNHFSILYLISITLLSMIFLILSVGLMVLKNIYKVAIDNKEENDLTI